MREVFVSDLVRFTLGPQNGAKESLNNSPLTEYITGILEPTKPGVLPYDSDEPEKIPVPGVGSGEDDHDDPPPSMSEFISPVLNVKNLPNSMGLSFAVDSSASRKMRVCVTWARYIKTGSVWKRHAKGWIDDVAQKNVTRHVFCMGNTREDANNEVQLRVYTREDGGARRVTIMLANKTPFTEDSPDVHHYLFQPQIRVILDTGTKLLPLRSSSSQGDEMEMLYKNSPAYARGHLTSALWKEIDPEASVQPELEQNAEAPNGPGFYWVDGDVLNDEDRQMFSAPDVRTEYVPMYSVLAPRLDQWRGKGSPVLAASDLAECYDTLLLKKALMPLADEYQKWINDLETNVAGSGVYSKMNIEKCSLAHARIVAGIERLCSDDDARLAFCFANKAIDLQWKWKSKEPFRYKPFQLAFVLATLDSALSPESEFRDTCDLLWVPTGGGKTETYLVTVALVLAHRRLKAMNSLREHTGAGVSVITRYTLRLLTIQQFRRSLSIITACEFLRVHGFGLSGNVGWRPPSCPNTTDVLWGSTPFSVGLWVGSSVTPNKLQTTPLQPGAMDLLEDPKPAYGDPAQVLECPACEAILAVPAMGLRPGEHTLHWILRSKNSDVVNACKTMKLSDLEDIVRVLDARITKNRPEGSFTMSLRFRSEQPMNPDEINRMWRKIQTNLKSVGMCVTNMSARASRPGYFERRLENNRKRTEARDFDIYCTNPACPLVTDWFGGAPYGKINGRSRDPGANTQTVGDVTLPDDNYLVDVYESFESERFVADRVPIPAYTVDDQVYANLPSMVVGTVDKFARLAFEPRTASLFGNVDSYNPVSGFERKGNVTLRSPGRSGSLPNTIRVQAMRPPDLIIQDELHLIDGPLGSMVGIYEVAISKLSRRKEWGPKYIASTATIQRADDHVQSIFERDVMLFPPQGLSADDRFFVVEQKGHPLQDRQPGRLYLGICAPGKGALTPLVRIWSRLAQTGQDNRNHPDIDSYWTVTGYFNTVRELGGARALYRLDIPERNQRLFDDPRNLPEDGCIELSSRTPSTDLPSILDVLNTSYPDAPDGLLTTSMFGTGVDISRIGLMVVNGQPKTTSSYIQSTGRVGRKRGALVVTLLRATKPRDLSHYEFFARHHMQLHRFVEPPTVFPFAPSVQTRSIGPVMVSILRNMRTGGREWPLTNDPSHMGNMSNSEEVGSLPDLLEDRAQSQPDGRKPRLGSVKNMTKSELDRWISFANEYGQELLYNQYTGTDKHVVLGDPKHKHAKKTSVYGNAPQSLREIEEEVGFQV